MSLKPLKKSDQKAAEKMKAHKRKKETISMLPGMILIISEGTKTEPLYFKGLAEKINDKYRKYTQNKRIVCIEGTGYNTIGLYDYLDKHKNPEELSEFSQIWLVYDKDDFPADKFDNTESKARLTKKSKWRVAWSNESFELWLLWYFQDYTSVTNRKEYVRLLEKHIGKYRKNDKNIYDKVTSMGSVDDAIRRAKKQIDYYEANGIVTPSLMKTASRVYELVELLNGFLL